MDNGDCDGTGVFLDVLIGNLFFFFFGVLISSSLCNEISWEKIYAE